MGRNAGVFDICRAKEFDYVGRMCEKVASGKGYRLSK